MTPSSISAAATTATATATATSTPSSPYERRNSNQLIENLTPKSRPISQHNTRIPFPAPRPSPVSSNRHNTSNSISTSTASLSQPISDLTLTSDSTNSQEVNMLKEQLAKLQAELRLAKGKSSNQDSNHSSSRTHTPSTLKRTHHSQSSHMSTSNSSQTLTPSPRHKLSSRSQSPRKRASSHTIDQTEEGLSIRLVTAPGLVQPSGAFLNPDSGFPTSDSGYIKDERGNWVPLQPNHSTQDDLKTSQNSSTSSSTNPNHQTLEDVRGLSRIPISAVSMGRVLAGDTAGRITTEDDENTSEYTSEGPHEKPETDLESSHVTSPSNPVPRRRVNRRIPSLQTLDESGGGPVCLSPGRESRSSVGSTTDHRPTNQTSSSSRQSRGNPFFGSGGGRDRGAMIHHSSHGTDKNGGNTGRVITNLQSDLLYARTALDQSKSQLRLSQRTVESLTRQTEDLKESMSRLRLENEGLSKMLARKERTVSELMERIKKSESELSTLKVEKKEIDSSMKKMTKETEEVLKESIRRRDRAEVQYEAVKSGVKSLSDGWKRDVIGLKSDMNKLEEKHRKELEESRLKYNTLAKLHASRSGALSSLESTLNSLQSTKETILNTYSIELKSLQTNLETDQQENQKSLMMTQEVIDECARFKRMLRDYHG
ncbi:uncharacterized protein MELLADRAFT_62960 [Melampsora larici-populina 98AG31]|uniref:SWI5-dependent HO expression protein 3 n=1 Tax=Melampsora larici-populina (strain 98AG31 / pathotype 3-4-7) TaxID=747676 RepID=F4RKS4_MELLP|nr:uncharacterized protein MELLADRAFT_62960 [Melampsora larici-populina 98AG31]EGG06779.1 hypothetical protein MELLADRAFT_62960 [Melampsora larici-populina 98AG31]